MKSLLLALFMFATTNAFADQPTPSTCTLAQLPGVYKGVIQGGGDWGETVFFTGMDGSLQGVYFMHFAEGVKTGHLQGLTFANGVMSGTWADEFGSGEISFQFTDLCASFSGLWNKSNPWEGTKTAN